MMKYLLNITFLITIYLLTACSEHQQEVIVSIDHTMTYDSLAEAKKAPDTSITKDGDWTVVTKQEKGNKVYWFVAPDINNVSPALFKKTIQSDDNSRHTLTVSKCEAPKKTCDELMNKFKTMSEKYK